MDSIMKANNLTADSILSIGMKLTIPQVRVASSPAKEESYEVYRGKRETRYGEYPVAIGFPRRI